MYTKLAPSTDSALGYRIDGALTRDEMLALTHELEQAIAASGKIRVLMDLNAFPYADLGAFWEDLKFTRHGKDIRRVALVGEREWERWAAKLFGALAGTETRFFDRLDEEKAWTWLKQESL